ncbi:MAG: 16S rRNA (cytosine(1402)-N(4))-methyltransferase RsmH [Akkermansia sp.]
MIWAAPEAELSTCYRVILWEDSAFSEEVLTQWRAQKAALVARMREAGIKGSRGILAQCSKELKELTLNTIERPLSTGGVAPLSLTRVGALAEALRAQAGVIAYRICPSCLQLLIELGETDELQAIIAQCAAAAPELTWSAETIIEAISGEQASEWQAACRADSGQLDAEDAAAAAELNEQAQDFHHLTVLAAEASDALQACEGRVLVDATLGGGGHTERLLGSGATVWGIDQDPIARAAAGARLAPFGTRFNAIAGNFRDIETLLASQGLEQVDGILADIGVSSPQLDCAERGFSFMHDGPLDMRMNPHAPLSAADIVNSYSEADIADILWQYGEERASRAIARRIVAERAKTPITTTHALAAIIGSVLPRKGKQNPATRSFQGLRIAVNDELGALTALMEQAVRVLRSGGRLAIITFHSLEDRAVKRFFAKICQAEIDRPEWPAPRPNPDYCAKLITRKPIVAGEEELRANPRSRSAKLRVIEKL